MEGWTKTSRRTDAWEIEKKKILCRESKWTISGRNPCRGRGLDPALRTSPPALTVRIEAEVKAFEMQLGVFCYLSSAGQCELNMPSFLFRRKSSSKRGSRGVFCCVASNGLRRCRQFLFLLHGKQCDVGFEGWNGGKCCSGSATRSATRSVRESVSHTFNFGDISSFFFFLNLQNL